MFEVEEYMGADFIEELAQMHFDHLKIIEHARFAQTQLSASATQQKSQPLFMEEDSLKCAKHLSRLNATQVIQS